MPCSAVVGLAMNMMLSILKQENPAVPFLAMLLVLEVPGDWISGIKSSIFLKKLGLIFGKMMDLIRVMFVHQLLIPVMRDWRILNGGRWKFKRNFIGG
ncbi:MAG: hypothetical protein K9I02_07435 [Haliscomenobacter sp.]|nr:hypothetical protein [Haliscomenobacter sp.]